MNIKLILLFVLFLEGNKVFSQDFSLIFEKQDIYEVEKIRPYLEKGKALIIVHSKYKLRFDSNVENISPVYSPENFYAVSVSAGKQFLTIDLDDDLYSGNGVINFGTFNRTSDSDNSVALNVNEIVCYKLILRQELDVKDITKNEINKGNNIVPFGPNVTDAMIQLRCFPTNLDLSITEENNIITRFTKRVGYYEIYLNLEKLANNNFPSLKISSKGVTDYYYVVDGLQSKGFKILQVRKPIIPDQQLKSPILSNEGDSPKPVTLRAPTFDYSYFGRQLIGNWAGSLGDENSYFVVDSINNDRKIFAKMYSDGIYLKLRGSVISDSNNIFHMTLRTDKSSVTQIENVTLDLQMAKGILNGKLMASEGINKDFSMSRSKNIAEDKTEILINLINAVNPKIEGTWKLTNNTIFDEIKFSGLNLKEKVNGVIYSGQIEVSQFSTKVRFQNDIIGFIQPITLFTNGIKKTAILSINFNKNECSGSLIFEDNGNSIPLRFIKSNPFTNLRNREKSLVKPDFSSFYYSNIEKAYFYSRPDVNFKTSKYILSGQIPQHLTSSGNFLNCSYTYLGETTTGYLLKSELGTYDLTSLIGSLWTGTFGDNNIRIHLSNFGFGLASQLSVEGYNELRGVRRNLKGTVVRYDSVNLRMILKEPGDAEWDGIFYLKISSSKSLDGYWESNNKRIRRDFKLIKI